MYTWRASGPEAGNPVFCWQLRVSGLGFQVLPDSGVDLAGVPAVPAEGFSLSGGVERVQDSGLGFA